MKRTHLILVGGFLGAGKTTLLASAAKSLRDRGILVGLITNDQAADLVDTGLLRHAGHEVKEIAGGCFCCRFDQLVDAAMSLMTEKGPGVLIGEPVGSCTDLSATVLQPIKQMHGDRLRLAPYSVLVDPERLREVGEPARQRPMHPSARYILRKQLDEADRIVVNKRDLLGSKERNDLAFAAGKVFPGKPISFVSALSGEGVSEWLDEMLSGTESGRHIVEVDYDVYAEGEAVLGWLNASATVAAHGERDWSKLCLESMERIRAKLNEREAAIAHLKLSLSTTSEQIVANLTANSEAISVRGHIDSHQPAAKLVVNARAEISPEELQSIFGAVLSALSSQADVSVDALHSLSPGRPTPTHRYVKVVE